MKRSLITTTGMLVVAAGVNSASSLAGPVAESPGAGVPKCPVTGEPANLAASVPADDGPVFFCCKDCIPRYKANPARYAAAVAEQRKTLAGRARVQVVCPITGDPVDQKAYIENQGQRVYFCCPKCVKRYQQNPAKYRAALANSYTYQTKCPVMQGDIDPQSFATAPGGEKVFFCCPRCEKKLFSEPGKYGPNLTAQGYTIQLQRPAPAGHGAAGHGGHGGHDH